MWHFSHGSTKVARTRDGNLEEFFRHENLSVGQSWGTPPALSDGESLRLGTKRDLLEDLSNPQLEAPDTTCLVLDGAVIVRMLKPAVAKNFDDYAQDVFIPSLSTKLQTMSRLDLVWDRYISDSLKGSAPGLNIVTCFAVLSKHFKIKTALSLFFYEHRFDVNCSIV